MNTLTIDIGGSKFSMAVFKDNRMVLRESQTTDKIGGRDWMLEQILPVAKAWQRKFDFNRYGIGFGGPVNFDEQRVVFSTHVYGWNDFRLSSFVGQQLKIPTIMDNDANVGALGLKACIMLLNPACIVIGGGISKVGDALFEPLRAELSRQITNWSRARIDVVPSELGDDRVLYGALVLSKELEAP